MEIVLFIYNITDFNSYVVRALIPLMLNVAFSHVKTEGKCFLQQQNSLIRQNDSQVNHSIVKYHKTKPATTSQTHSREVMHLKDNFLLKFLMISKHSLLTVRSLKAETLYIAFI